MVGVIGGVEAEFLRQAEVARWERQCHQAVRQPGDEVEVTATSVGESLAIVGHPTEYFTEFGLETKARLPFRRTMVAELANGRVGYVHTQQAFAHGRYEARRRVPAGWCPRGATSCSAGTGLLRLRAAGAPTGGS